MKQMVVILWLLFLMSLCLAQGSRDNLKTQTKPNLNGIWVLDMAESDFGIPKRELKYNSLTVMISHQDPELKIDCKRTEKKKERSQELVYYTDGRGEKNSSFNEKETVQTMKKRRFKLKHIGNEMCSSRKVQHLNRPLVT